MKPVCNFKSILLSAIGLLFAHSIAASISIIQPMLVSCKNAPDNMLPFQAEVSHGGESGQPNAELRRKAQSYFLKYELLNVYFSPTNLEEIGPLLHAENLVGVVYDLRQPTMVYRKETSSKGNQILAVRHFESGQWSPAKAYNIEGMNEFESTVDFHINEDASVLLFAGKKKKGLGDYDIYVSFRKIGYQWEKPIRLESASTPADDRSPYLVNNTYLFFSTTNPERSSSKDIFVTKAENNRWESWSVAQPLGSKVNSSKDEVRFEYSQVKNRASITRVDEHQQESTLQLKLFLEEEILSAVSHTSNCSARSFFDKGYHHNTTDKSESPKCYTFSALDLEWFDPETMDIHWYNEGYLIGKGTDIDYCFEEGGKKTIVLNTVNSTIDYEFKEELEINIEIKPDIEVLFDKLNMGSFYDHQKHYSLKFSNVPEDLTNIEVYWNFGDGNYACGAQVYTMLRSGFVGKGIAVAVITLPGEEIILSKEFEVDGRSIY